MPRGEMLHCVRYTAYLAFSTPFPVHRGSKRESGSSENKTRFHSGQPCSLNMWFVDDVSLGPVARQQSTNPLSFNLRLTVNVLKFTTRSLRCSLLTSKEVENRFCKLNKTINRSSLAPVARLRPNPGLLP